MMKDRKKVKALVCWMPRWAFENAFDGPLQSDRSERVFGRRRDAKLAGWDNILRVTITPHQPKPKRRRSK